MSQPENPPRDSTVTDLESRVTALEKAAADELAVKQKALAQERAQALGQLSVLRALVGAHDPDHPLPPAPEKPSWLDMLAKQPKPNPALQAKPKGIFRRWR